MPPGRHRKTVPARVRAQQIGLPAAVTLALATGAAGSTAIERSPQQTTTAASATVPSTTRSAPVRDLTPAASRSLQREEMPSHAELEEIAERVQPDLGDLKPRWLTADLNVWSGAGEGTRLLTVLDGGAKVRFTGLVRGRWAQIMRGDRLVWVRKTYLAREKPAVGSDAPVSGAPCPDGSAVESGLQPNTVAVYRSVCAAFPEVSSWGGRSGSGDHGAGLALDIMATGSLGSAIADYVRAHAGELGVSEVIWAQRIWTVQRSSEGWRPMEDRGSTTANHYDHVHVSVY
jgi:hypothetical protein